MWRSNCHTNSLMTWEATCDALFSKRELCSTHINFSLLSNPPPISHLGDFEWPLCKQAMPPFPLRLHVIGRRNLISGCWSCVGRGCYSVLTWTQLRFGLVANWLMLFVSAGSFRVMCLEYRRWILINAFRMRATRRRTVKVIVRYASCMCYWPLRRQGSRQGWQDRNQEACNEWRKV